MIFLRWMLNIVILILIAEVVPGINFTGLWAAIMTSIVLGFLNAIIRPLLIILTLPVNILTLGLFTFVINGLMFWLASTIVKGFDIQNFGAAFFGALIYTIITMAISMLEENKKKPKVIKAKKVK